MGGVGVFHAKGCGVEKLVPSKVCFLGFAGGKLGCPGNFARMSRTPGGVQKVCAKKKSVLIFRYLVEKDYLVTEKTEAYELDENAQETSAQQDKWDLPLVGDPVTPMLLQARDSGREEWSRKFTCHIFTCFFCQPGSPWSGRS